MEEYDFLSTTFDLEDIEEIEVELEEEENEVEVELEENED